MPGRRRCGRGRPRRRTRLARDDVVRDRQHDRHAVGQRVLEGDEDGGRRIPVAHRVGAHAHRRGERDLVDTPRARPRGGLVAHDEEEGDAGLGRLGQRREGVGEARAVGGGRGGETSRGAIVGVGGDDSAGLVPHRGEGKVGLAVQHVEEVRVPVSHHPEDVVEVAGEGVRDVGGDGGHGEGGLSRRTEWMPYVSRALRATCPFFEQRRTTSCA